jgi:cyclophilin family peptidyl-prolyl cis-trans isomerase
MTTIRLLFFVTLYLSAVSTNAFWTISDHRRDPRWTTATNQDGALPIETPSPSERAAVSVSSRRLVLKNFVVAPAIVAMGLYGFPTSAAAASSTDEAQVTDRIFVEIKGLPSTSSSSSSATEPRRIVIGLFGKDAPNTVSKLKNLVTSQGLATSCRPKAERALQREQLEANQVYNMCKEDENRGINLLYSTVWRIIQNERIDVGAVSGKFVAREFPDFQEENGGGSGSTALKHDAPGVVSVRRGNEGGFGFTIYPGNGEDARFLDEEHIVVGRVIEGMDVVRELNDVPVIASSKFNYMGLTGGPTTKSAPTRSCRYGGPMYCNENKPLVKLSIVNAGIA